MADEFVVDLMTQAGGVTYDDAAGFIEWVEVEGAKMPYLQPEMLIQTKKTDWPVDSADRAYPKELLQRSENPGGRKSRWPW